ncbi:hypothetical protein COT97_01610 [Candidatus Falkowbacteria bacterium CG10_big_fil_rev_8_21_14_0_10_39_11]|uniref:L,D-TPase catalytic domain-containing protein n=1 Tax=Candidatus Falkowbacteria bacterium CG10_big_fil_rev_8_21_14_0_10_39_11 TaxID=1974565 RepID=A0A2H0V5P8_9BACT|nr:MAG: hypothetical protein COT97_01610 [Candidatus Falkowbacteria bacterium CG10_big_fil_rev_8_21_14_0_10_39_11]
MNKYLVVVFFIVVAGCFYSFPVVANDGVAFDELKVYSNNLQLINSTSLFNGDFSGYLDFDLIDVGGDGVDEVLLGVGYQEKPLIRLLRGDGSEINSWQPYSVGYEGRVNVASFDFDGDGKEEIITVPGEGGGPQVRIFDGYGQSKFTPGFFAYDASYRNGMELAVGDVNGDGTKEIIVSLFDEGKNIVSFFDRFGNKVLGDFTVELDNAFEPMKIAALDINQDGKDDVIMGSGVGMKSAVWVYNMSGDKLLEFDAYGSGFRGGVDVSVSYFNNIPYITTAAGFSGGPHVRFFDLAGQPKINPTFFVYDEGFKGGVNVSFGNLKGKNEVVVMPQTLQVDGDLSSNFKVIKVDLSEQRLYAYVRGRLDKTFLISSGKWGFDTPVGTFKIFKKRPLVRMSWVYGPNNPNNYDLPNVPDVLSFSGVFTIHGAYWHNNFGHRMSHGCVNVDLKNSKWIYDWAPMGIPVIVQP